MLDNEKGQSLIEVLVVLVIATMMTVSLIIIILISLKNAQFAQNQTRATKIAQDTIDQIRILRDDNKNGTLSVPLVETACFNRLWDYTARSNFDCRNIRGFSDCYYELNSSGILDRRTSQPDKAVPLTSEPGFSRSIKVTQNSINEIKLAVEISWADSSGGHSSNLETYLIKPNYDCID